MVALSPGLFLVAVQSAFRLGREFQLMRNDRARMQPFTVLLPPTGDFNLEEFAKKRVRDSEALRSQFADLFDESNDFKSRIDVIAPFRYQEAISAGVQKFLEEKAELGAAASELDRRVAGVSVTPLLDASARKTRRRRFAMTLIDISIDAVATQPDILGLKPRAEAALGGLASNIQALLPTDEEIADGAGFSFKERASQLFLRAALQTIAEDPTLIVRREHMASLVKATLAPLAEDMASRDQTFTLDRLTGLLRGPMARAALEALHTHQSDFLGARFTKSRAAGAVVEGILASALKVEPGAFDLADAFSQRGLTTILKGALSAAEAHPDLFIRGDGGAVASGQEFLRKVASTMRGAPEPFSIQRQLGAEVAQIALDIAVDHAGRLAAARVTGDDPWDLVTKGVIGSIFAGFREALPDGAATAANAGAAPGAATLQRRNPFIALFNQNQALDIVRIIAAQAAKTPGMLTGGPDKAPEVQALARSIATFMADPATRLASSADWMAVIAVASEEAARNPDTLLAPIAGDATTRPPLLDALVAMFLRQATASFQSAGGEAAAAGRRRGALLFGDTLRLALEATIRAAANNAEGLLNETAHMSALEAFVGRLQTFAASRGGAIGASEWIWLYRRFVAHVIDKGAGAQISEVDFNKALHLASTQGTEG